MNVRLYPAVAPLAVGSVRPTERVRLYPAETLSAMQSSPAYSLSSVRKGRLSDVDA
jgi:hypothetical protein